MNSHSTGSSWARFGGGVAGEQLRPARSAEVARGPRSARVQARPPKAAESSGVSGDWWTTRSGARQGDLACGARPRCSEVPCPYASLAGPTAVVNNGRTLAIVARMALATVFAAAAGLLAPAIAFAHADLASSVPTADSTVARSPQRIVLRFTEQPDPRLSKASLLDSAGRPVPGASPLEAMPGHPLSLQIVLSRPLPKGVYTVDWFSVSAVDGHTVPGAFAFGVGLPPGAGGLAPDPFSTSPWASAAAATGRWLLYIGLLALIGGASPAWSSSGGVNPPLRAGPVGRPACSRPSPTPC